MQALMPVTHREINMSLNIARPVTGKGCLSDTEVDVVGVLTVRDFREDIRGEPMLLCKSVDTGSMFTCGGRSTTGKSQVTKNI